MLNRGPDLSSQDVKVLYTNLKLLDIMKLMRSWEIKLTGYVFLIDGCNKSDQKEDQQHRQKILEDHSLLESQMTHMNTELADEKEKTRKTLKLAYLLRLEIAKQKSIIQARVEHFAFF